MISRRHIFIPVCQNSFLCTDNAALHPIGAGLSPVIARQAKRQSRSRVIKIGAKVVSHGGTSLSNWRRLRCRGSCSEKSSSSSMGCGRPLCRRDNGPFQWQSRPPDRTGVCCAGRSAPSQCGVVTGSGFSSPNQPGQVRTTAYHDGSGPDSRSDAHSAIIVGGWEKQSGESRVCLAKQLGSLLRVARWGAAFLIQPLIGHGADNDRLHV